MRKNLIIIAIMFFAIGLAGLKGQLLAQTKTIHVTPSTALIYVDGNEVGTGTYKLKFNRKDDFVILKFEAAGYMTRELKLLKTNPQKTIAYKLPEDEALANSIGGDGVDLANKWFDITAKKGMSEDEVWKRLMSIASKYFENLETRDKTAGWIKSTWAFTSYALSNQIVRTNLEVKVAFGTEDELRYRVRLNSEIGDLDCGKNSECFSRYDRVLRRYEAVIEEFQRTIGG